MRSASLPALLSTTTSPSPSPGRRFSSSTSSPRKLSDRWPNGSCPTAFAPDAVVMSTRMCVSPSTRSRTVPSTSAPIRTSPPAAAASAPPPLVVRLSLMFLDTLSTLTTRHLIGWPTVKASSRLCSSPSPHWLRCARPFIPLQKLTNTPYFCTPVTKPWATAPGAASSKAQIRGYSDRTSVFFRVARMNLRAGLTSRTRHLTLRPLWNLLGTFEAPTSETCTNGTWARIPGATWRTSPVSSGPAYSQVRTVPGWTSAYWANFWFTTLSFSVQLARPSTARAPTTRARTRCPTA